MQYPSNCFICPIPNYTVLQVSGADALTFLQGQITQDVSKISTTTLMLGAHCDPKGRVVANFFAWRENDEQNEATIFLCTYQETLILLYQSLRKYAVFSKVTLKILSPINTKSLEKKSVEKKSVEQLDPSNPLQKVAYPWPFYLFGIWSEHSLASSTLNQNKIMPLHHFEKIGLFLHHKRPESTIDFISTEQQLALAKWQYETMLYKIALLTPENSGKFTPHDLNLPDIGGVSFQKGCYIGQEIVARMHYLGKPKQQLYLFAWRSVIEPGAQLHNDQGVVVGTIINIVKQPEDHLWALAVIKNQAVAAQDVFLQGERVKISTEGLYPLHDYWHTPKL